MSIKAADLIAELIETIRRHLNQAEYFKQLPLQQLNQRPGPESWSILECLEHLNLYGDFYLPELEKRIDLSNFPPEPYFNSGWLGNYFANSMLPKEKLNKMKTFKDKNPLGSKLDKSAIDRFIGQQKKLLELLERSRKISLTKTRTSISISSWVQLRLGDTFRFIINHDQRHIVQAIKVLEAQKNLKA